MKNCYIVCIISVILAFITSCRTDKQSTEQKIIDLDSIDFSNPKKVLNSIDTVGEGLPIFYNMYLSVEMSTLFESVGAVFNDDLLNIAEKTTDYITSSKKSLNIGVYAVDLSYCRIFEQFEIAGRYFNSMQKLSEELGIPSDYFLNTAKRFNRNINDKDSLIYIANEVYNTTEKYLRDNEQYSSASQIILGGWIEAMHIAFDVANTTKDIEILQRIAEQKHSLKNLCEMLSAYQDNDAIKIYLKKLETLQESLDKFIVDVELDFDPNSTDGIKAINGYLKQMSGLQKQVDGIRAEIVD